MLASTQEDGELAFRCPQNLVQNEMIKRDIAYLIKSLKTKKRIKNDFTARRSSYEDTEPGDFIEEADGPGGLSGSKGKTFALRESPSFS